MAKGPGRYTETPIQLVVRGTPIPRAETVPTAPREGDEGPWPTGLKLGGIASGPIQAERARQEADSLLRHYADRIRRGDRTAILELLDLNPAFIGVGWVRETLGRLLVGGLSLRGRGRPRGRYARHPLFVVGLVRYLIESGDAQNPEQAFGQLAERGLVPSYDAAKHAYYQARREPRFRPILLEFPEFAREVPAEDVGRRPPDRVLESGTEIIVEGGPHPLLGHFRLTFRGNSPQSSRPA